MLIIDYNEIECYIKQYKATVDLDVRRSQNATRALRKGTVVAGREENVNNKRH